MIRTRRLLDRCLQLDVVDDSDGNPTLTVLTHRPLDHSLLIARLLDWMDEAAEAERGPRRATPVLEFRPCTTSAAVES